ncbi:MAG: CBS domain-containing protein, partial [Caldilineaceae bacterium]
PERGLNLDVLNQFLHHPLGEEQRHLLEGLIARSEVVEVEGHTIVVAQGEALGKADEISTVAARLRDFHEQDAVFLVIQIDEMVQVVARSVTDEVDVGAVARALGGGGHTRAAAAPVRGKSPAELRDEIVRLVREQVRARTTVRHIMSSGRPHTLPPAMAVEAAAEQMRRYGHEGFPVVATGADGGQLVGVLTRREADRAIAHGLGREPVHRFMSAGNINVRPDDSLPTLRRTMIDSGWGQIPVVDERGRMIGIVTRTDLIKTWDDSRTSAHRAGEMERRLATLLTPIQFHLLKLLGEEATELGFTVYVVGGFVRDLLMGQAGGRVQSFDVDIVLEGDGIQFANHLHARYGGRVVQHRQFNTAKWILGDDEAPVVRERLLAPLPDAHVAPLPAHLDFVSARTEFYTAPTVLPTVENSSIKLDLHRRDFTVNTLALCLNPDRWGQLLDFWGGVTDLHNGKVRVLHSLSFVDDPTRILRAVRYEQRFGFQIDPRTLELIADALELLERVTPARIRHELERILQEAEPERILLRLETLGVLRCISPKLNADMWVEQSFPQLRSAWSAETWPSRNAPGHELAAGLVADLRGEPLERLYWVTLLYRANPVDDAAISERLGLRKVTQTLMDDVRQLQADADRLRLPNLIPSQVVEILDRADPAAA